MMNLFGDILFDEAAGDVGSLELAPGLNHNDDGYAMAQTTHSAPPDIAGGIANPTSSIPSGALLLEWIGRHVTTDATEAVTAIHDAVTRTINGGCRTPGIGGDSTTGEFTDAVIDRPRAS